MNRRRSLPGMPPPGAYFPPAPSAQDGAPAELELSNPVVSDVGSTCETASAELKWPNAGEVSVYTTTKQWRACDVFLSQKAAQHFNGVFTVRVYALTAGGLRALIATGRLGRYSQLVVNVAPRMPMWVAAARAQAVRFEITLEYQSTGPTPLGLITLSLMASNEANEPPEWVGTVRALANAGPALSSVQIPDPELVLVQAVPMVGVAAARFLHIHDRGNVAVAALTPAFVFPICDAAGAPVGSGSFPCRFRSASGFFNISASSTADITTVELDCIMQAVLR